MKTTHLAAFLLLSLITLNSCTKTLTDQNDPELAGTSTAAANAAAAAIFKVSGVFGDSMVIQRDKPASVWGTAPTGKTISVKASWDNTTYTATANKTGQWRVMIPATPVNTTPQQLLVSDGVQTTTFKGILIGDVWVCSGQSNMEMPLDSVSPPYEGFDGVVNYQQEIADANWPLLRVIKLQPDYEPTPVYDITYPASWSSCNPAAAKDYSAVAYYFGRKLTTTLNVPIGLVVSAVGGTSCEWWTNKAKLDADPVLSAYYTSDWRTSRLFNGMINPLRFMAIKGFTWYQGENNRYDKPTSNYTKLNSEMIKGWRGQFNQGTLPFYYVQVAPFDVNWNKYSEPRDNDYAFFREAQAQIRKGVGATGMAVTMDAGDIKRIHPKDKKPVGERLALLALHRTYGLAVKDVGPQYSSCTFTNNKATINFVAGTSAGLKTRNNEPLGQYFFVAGADNVFRQGTAVISGGNKIIVTASPDTPLPLVAVRYAFTNYPMPNLQNKDGLPMEAFRTDNWSN